MQKIVPFLWFDNQAEAAVNFYLTVFRNSKIQSVSHYNEVVIDKNEKEEKAMSLSFEIDGQSFIAFNGGPYFSFTPAISLFINCEKQDEVDELWEKLSDGGEKGQCGWLKDKFGISWQVVPTILDKLLSDADTEKSQRVMNAMLQMHKIEISELMKAYEGK